MTITGEKSKHEANSSLTTAFDSVEHSCTTLKPQYLLLPCQIQPWCSSRHYPWSTFQLPLKQVIHVHNLVQHSSAGTHLSRFIKSCPINSWNSVMINLISTKNSATLAYSKLSSSTKIVKQSAHNMVVIFDTDLCFYAQVKNVIQSCFCQL